jgi:hypothetical protein
MSDKTYTVVLNPRVSGKLTKALVAFYSACMRDENAVLMTPKGRIVSPKHLELNYIPRTESNP